MWMEPPTLLFATVVVGGLVLLFGRVWIPWATAPRGDLIRRERLSLFGRLRLHAGPTMLVLALTLGGWAAGLIPGTVVALLAVAIAVLIALPVRYILTTDGIAVGRTPFRRWTEFGGVARRRGGVQLQGVAGARGTRVWLSGSRGDDEFVLLLRQLVRGSYKGHVGPASVTGRPAQAADEPAIRSLERAGAAR